MIREYLKMIGRRILRHKIYAIINVVGFTIAFTSVLLIYMHVVKEWKTDRFHQHADQIYRVTLKSKYDQICLPIPVLLQLLMPQKNFRE